jgi:D-alanine--poly(phosphoribitol) ligase subunit 2
LDTDKILALIIEVTQEPALAEERDVDLVESGLLDSMASVELMVMIEDEFGIEIPPTALDNAKMNTVNGIIAQVAELIESRR